MGFPSPATDYTEQRLTVNSICNVGPNTLVFEQSGGYVVLDISLKPKQGSQVLIQHGGGTELATLRGRSLITEDGEAIEGEALGRCCCYRGRDVYYLRCAPRTMLLFSFSNLVEDFAWQASWGMGGAYEISEFRQILQTTHVGCYLQPLKMALLGRYLSIFKFPASPW